LDRDEMTKLSEFNIFTMKRESNWFCEQNEKRDAGNSALRRLRR